jgi:hypothetical protein
MSTFDFIIVAANTNAPAMAIADKATEIMLKE